MELQIIGRQNPLFEIDLCDHRDILETVVSSSRFLVIGGAGTIG